MKDAGGVRFFRHYEQIVQLITYGLDKVIDDILKPSLDHGWSKESCNKLLERFDGEDMNPSLEMAMIEAVAISDFGKTFCTSYYILERNSPLILCAHEVLKKIDDIVQRIDGSSLPTVAKVVEKAA